MHVYSCKQRTRNDKTGRIYPKEFEHSILHGAYPGRPVLFYKITGGMRKITSGMPERYAGPGRASNIAWPQACLVDSLSELRRAADMAQFLSACACMHHGFLISSNARNCSGVKRVVSGHEDPVARRPTTFFPESVAKGSRL